MYKIARVRTTTLLLALAALLSLGFYGHAEAKPSKDAARQAVYTPPVPTIDASRFNVAFDAGHGEIFSPAETGTLHYSDFNKEFEAAGASTFISTAPITTATLSQFDTYVVAGPTKEFTEPEIRALHEYVANGGNLLVLLHISSPVARLTESFNILVSNVVISEGVDTIKEQSQDFYVTRLNDHPVTRGIERIAVYGTWGLMAEADAKSLASTSKEAWADSNRNRTYDEGEQKGQYTLIASSTKGLGNVLVVADDAPFANLFFSTAQNRTLGKNIIEWFKKASNK